MAAVIESVLFKARMEKRTREVMMQSTNHQSLFDNPGPAIFGFNLKNRMVAVIISFAIVLLLCCNTYGGNDPNCGDEVRIETRDGTTFHGNLLLNNGHSLVLWSYSNTQKHSLIRLEDVETIYRIKSLRRECALVGMLAGGVAGFAVAKSVNARSESREFMSSRKFFTCIGVTLCGTVIGSLVGGVLGQKIVRYQEIQLGVLPICSTSPRDEILIRMSFAI